MVEFSLALYNYQSRVLYLPARYLEMEHHYEAPSKEHMQMVVNFGYG